MQQFQNVAASSVLRVRFNTFDAGANSCTITNFDLTNIRIYKDSSMTQRSSSAGITLVDTDGIDLDGVVGCHGFDIDLADNTDAGFYSAGAFLQIMVVGALIEEGELTEATVNPYVATAQLAGAPAGDVTVSSASIAAIVAAVFDTEQTEQYSTNGAQFSLRKFIYDTSAYNTRFRIVGAQYRAFKLNNSDIAYSVTTDSATIPAEGFRL